MGYLSECNRVYTPYTKKGIQYFSSRCVTGCGNAKKSCNLSYIETELGKLMPELFLEPHELEELDQKADTGIAHLEAKLNKEKDQSDRKQRKLNEDLSYLRENRLDLLKSGVYSPSSYIEEEQHLIAELTEIKESEVISQEALHQTIKEAMKLSELLNNLTV